GPVVLGRRFREVFDAGLPDRLGTGCRQRGARTCGWVGGGRSSVLLGWLRLVGQLVLAGRQGRPGEGIVLRFPLALWWVVVSPVARSFRIRIPRRGDVTPNEPR